MSANDRYCCKSRKSNNLKISRKYIFVHLRCCFAFQCHYVRPWSILDAAIWSLTSLTVKRTSGSRNFPSTAQKDFCNNICQEPTSPPHSMTSSARDSSVG